MDLWFGINDQTVLDQLVTERFVAKVRKGFGINDKTFIQQ